MTINADFNPDWDRLKACRDSLREHMSIARELKAKNAALADAVQLAVDLVESDVILVRPSEREELMSALTIWNAVLARTQNAEGE